MTQFDVTIGNHEDTVIAVSAVGKCKVAATRSIGDAASPVYVRAGDYVKQAGQVADYRHDIEAAAQQNDCRASVSGYYGDDQWIQTVRFDEDSDEIEGRILAIIRKRISAREVAEQEKRTAEAKAKAEQRKLERANIDKMIMAMAREAAEAWAPGRVAVWTVSSGRLFAGRWDAPFIPGHGTPTETREVIVTDLRRFEGEAAKFEVNLAQ
jgi:hypothetical protein